MEEILIYKQALREQSLKVELLTAQIENLKVEKQILKEVINEMNYRVLISVMPRTFKLEIARISAKI